MTIAIIILSIYIIGLIIKLIKNHRTSEILGEKEVILTSYSLKERKLK